MRHNGMTLVLATAVFLAGLGFGPDAASAATRKRAPTKVSSSQLFMKLDMLNAKMDQLMKSAGSAPAAPAKQVVVAPSGGGETHELVGAFYNYGVYKKSAEDERLAARLVRDLCVLGGGVLATAGYETDRDRTVARTIANSFKYYPGFSAGISVVFTGVIVSEFLEMAANRSDAKAARSLMKPLEETPAPSEPASTSSDKSSGG